MVSTKNKTEVDFKIFRATGIAAWEKPLTAAAEFAATLERDQIINISHSSDEGNGTVVVWYERRAS